MTFGIVEASLVSIIVESILFGFFSVLFTLSSYLLLYKKTVAGPPRMRFFYALSVMYGLAIMHISINIQRSLEGFTRRFDEPGGALVYFDSTQGLLNILRVAIYVLQGFVGDGIMIYRLYVICSGDYQVMVPTSIMLAGNVASGIGAIVAYSEDRSTFQLDAKVLRWMIAFFMLTFLINLCGTLLITIRIWLARRKTSSTSQTPGFSPLTVMLLDPGIIYSASLLCLFGLFLADNNALYIVFESEIQIIGIVLSLIIIRIGFRTLWNGSLDCATVQGPRLRLRVSPKAASRDSTWRGPINDPGSGSSFNVFLDATPSSSTNGVDLKANIPDGRDAPLPSLRPESTDAV